MAVLRRTTITQESLYSRMQTRGETRIIPSNLICITCAQPHNNATRQQALTSRTLRPDFIVESSPCVAAVGADIFGIELAAHMSPEPGGEVRDAVVEHWQRGSNAHQLRVDERTVIMDLNERNHGWARMDAAEYGPANYIGETCDTAS